MKKNKIHIAWYSDKVTEGGIARNHAIAYSLKNLGYKVINFYPSNILMRFINIPRMTYYLYFMKNKKVVIHGNFFITNYLVQIINFNLYVNIIHSLLLRFISRNELIIEINDLRVEQTRDVKGIDLSYKFISAEYKLLYEHKNREVNYIFASNLMRDFSIEKYGLDFERTSVILNGGPKSNYLHVIDNNFSNNKIKCIYAGTLNKGRQIESMINIFNQISNIELILIGIGGEWIKKCNYKSNIKYLGSMTENEAHKIVASCDLGLIPYSTEKQYYNICYPTKASFYITANIPFLSTNTDELIYNFSNKNICLFSDLDDWGRILSNLERDQINILKENIKLVSSYFDWDNLILKNPFLISDFKDI